MAVDMDNLFAEVTLAVPSMYRDFLNQWRIVRETLASVFYLSLLGVYYYLWRHGRAIVDLLPHLLLLFLSALVLQVTRHLYRDWHYKLDGRAIKLVCWQWQDKVWQWHEMQWRQDVIINVQPDEWRGLPACALK